MVDCGRKCLDNSRMASRTAAVSYLRVSGKGQVEGDGFPRQREAVTRFATRNGYELVDEFRDEGVSGTKELSDRPGLAALIDRVESNGVKVVVVERADRLARDLMVSEVIIDQLTRAGAQVLTADGDDLTSAEGDPTRTLIRQVLDSPYAPLSTFAGSILAARLAGGHAARRRLCRRPAERCSR